MPAPSLIEPGLEPNPVVRVDGVNFAYGEGDAQNQVLFDIGLTIEPGQLVVMTGPSGSGKTTLLTLVGALRSLQQGRVEILGHDLSRLGPGGLVRVRRDVGFIFQMHNLFESLSAPECEDGVAARRRRFGRGDAQRGVAMLERPRARRPRRLQAALAVGRTASAGGDRRARSPTAPRLVLADEPTAALDPRLRPAMSSACSRI